MIAENNNSPNQLLRLSAGQLHCLPNAVRLSSGENQKHPYWSNP